MHFWIDVIQHGPMTEVWACWTLPIELAPGAWEKNFYARPLNQAARLAVEMNDNTALDWLIPEATYTFS